MRNEQADRVPIHRFVAEFVGKYAGNSCQELCFDLEKVFDATCRCAANFAWDAVQPNMVAVWAGLCDAIGELAMVAARPLHHVLAVLGGLLICLAASTLHAVTFHVATDGNDAWSGKLARPNTQKTDGPFASPLGHRNAIRRLRARGPLTEPVEVIIAGGVYRLVEPLVFEPQDSGAAAAPIVYRAADGTRPVLSGGRRISGFKKGEGPLWVAEIPADDKWQFRQLFINGRRACRARTPIRAIFTLTACWRSPIPSSNTGKSRSTASASSPATCGRGRTSTTPRSWCSTRGTPRGSGLSPWTKPRVWFGWPMPLFFA